MRVFVNAQAIDVGDGASALECVRRWQAAEADAVQAGTRLITDSRGLPVTEASVARPGSIYRTISNRTSANPDV